VSVNEVRKLIRRVRPDEIFVELCRERIAPKLYKKMMKTSEEEGEKGEKGGGEERGKKGGEEEGEDGGSLAFIIACSCFFLSSIFSFNILFSFINN